MRKIVHTLGALVALFSFSACSINPSYSQSSPLGQVVGTSYGYVLPTHELSCIKPFETVTPLPKNVPHATYYNVGSPPVRFRKNNKVMMHFDSPNEINASNGKHGHPVCDETVFAWTSGDNKDMHLPNPCLYPETDAYARLACHELGHVNGWPEYHGD